MIKQRKEEEKTQLKRALRKEQQLRIALYKKRQKRSNLTRQYVNIMTDSGN